MQKSRILFLIIFASAQISHAEFSKGHQILLNRGLQLQGLAQDDCFLTLSTYSNANYTSIHWINSVGTNGVTTTHSSRPDWMGNPPGFPWARWAINETQMPPHMTPYGGDEIPYTNQLIGLVLGDEWNLNDDATRTRLVNWFAAVRTNWPNTLLYHNNWGSQIGDTALADFYTRAKPDMLCFDTYPWQSVYDTNQPNHTGPAISGPPTGWYGDFRRYREHGKAAGVPLAFYRHTWHAVQDYDSHVFRDPSRSELRLQTFAGLAFNAKYFTDFLYNTGAASLFTKTFNGSGDTVISSNGLYAEMTDVNFRARNFGKTMVRLTPITNELTAGYTTSMMFIRGKDPAGNFTTTPIGFLNTRSAAYTDWVYQQNDPYLTNNWAVTNTGVKNNGQPGDVIISWFKPLDESFDGPDYSEERYLMVVNGLSDPTGTAADCSQEIKLNFAGSLLAIEMMNPLTGLVEVIPLPLTNGLRQLVLNLNGGDGVLFKFADGAPFVGAPVVGSPVIARQPASRTNLIGTDATFNAVASGASPFSYQWRFDGANISSATTNNYTRTNVQMSDAGGYSVVVSNASGSATSAVASLSVLMPPEVSAQPQSQTVSSGSNPTFTVTASGNPTPNFQWRFNGANISGATLSTYTRLNVQSIDSGNYSVFLSNAVGTTVSSNAILTVNGPPSITTQPQSKSVLVGASATFTLGAVGTGPFVYRWKKNNIDFMDSGSTSGSTTSSLTFGNVQTSDVGNYSVVVSNAFGATTSASASLSIATQPAIQVQPQSRTNNSGSVATFNVVASGGGLNYQWKRGGTNIANGGNISGANTDNLVINPTIKLDATNYTVTISNVAGYVTSAPVTLTILNPLPWREPFLYTLNSNLGGQTGPSSLPWADVGTSTTGPFVTIDSGNLNVTNLAPAFGNRIRFGGLGKSARLSFSPAFTNGTIYFSFALSVADLTGANATGIFIAGLNNSAGTQTLQPSVVAPRIYLRTASGGFNLGVAKSSDTDWFWDPRVFNVGQTIFIVGSYALNTGSTTDDVAKLWINPNPADFGSGAAPTTPSVTALTGNDLTGNVVSFVFFQRSMLEPAVMFADELRIGTSWASVTPGISPLQINSATLSPDGLCRLQGTGNPGNFIIETSENLTGWSEVTNILNLSGTFDYTESTREVTQRFFRVRSAP